MKARRLLLRALGVVCGVTTQLPHAMVLSDGLYKSGEIAVASGGFTDTWRGSYQTKNVALKAFRTYPVQDSKEAEKVRPTIWMNIAVICRRPLVYPVDEGSTLEEAALRDVLLFYGVDMTNLQLGLVYDWAESDNIIWHLNSNPNISRTCLVLSSSRNFTRRSLTHDCILAPRGRTRARISLLFRYSSQPPLSNLITSSILENFLPIRVRVITATSLSNPTALVVDPSNPFHPVTFVLSVIYYTHHGSLALPPAISHPEHLSRNPSGTCPRDVSTS